MAARFITNPRRNPAKPLDGSVHPTRVSQVNAYLAANGFPDYELVRGEGYFYFFGPGSSQFSTAVYVYRVSDHTLARWLDSLQGFLKENADQIRPVEENADQTPRKIRLRENPRRSTRYQKMKRVQALRDIALKGYTRRLGKQAGLTSREPALDDSDESSYKRYVDWSKGELLPRYFAEEERYLRAGGRVERFLPDAETYLIGAKEIRERKRRNPAPKRSSAKHIVSGEYDSTETSASYRYGAKVLKALRAAGVPATARYATSSAYGPWHIVVPASHEDHAEAVVAPLHAAHAKAFQRTVRKMVKGRKNPGALATLGLMGGAFVGGMFAERKLGYAARAQDYVSRARKRAEKPTPAPVVARMDTDPKWSVEEEMGGKGLLHTRRIAGLEYSVFERIYGNGDKVVILDVFDASGKNPRRIPGGEGSDGEEWKSVAAAKAAAEKAGGLKKARKKNPARRKNPLKEYSEDYNVFFNEEGDEIVPETFKKVNAVVVSSAHDEPALLTRDGVQEFEYLADETYTPRTPRHHPVLVWMALRRPHYFRHKVTVEDVPGGVYAIERGPNGFERVLTPDNSRWVTI